MHPVPAFLLDISAALLFNQLHILSAADQRSTTGPGHFHFIPADQALVLLAFFLYCHFAYPFIYYFNTWDRPPGISPLEIRFYSTH